MVGSPLSCDVASGGESEACIDGARLVAGSRAEDVGVVSPRAGAGVVVDVEGMDDMPLPELLDDFDSTLTTSMGRSATPIIILLMVPTSADAPPEIGSQGPSSLSYSFER